MSDMLARLNAALSGRYRVERQLGEGGMATVYLADDLRHGRKVALKLLKPELAAVVGAERFLAEIRTTASLQHPHILPLFDSGEADGLLYYVMPRVEGESLRERLDRERQLPVDEAVRIATNVAEALHYAHRHGVIHRDIKPANILLLDGEPVISDFGIALAVTSGSASRMTETGLSLGTPHYMSPEQATGDQSVGPATDIWALGCVLYEMLVGEPPYTGSTPQAVLGKIITAEPPSVREARRSVPANVDAAIRKALEKVPADRFHAAQDLAKALSNAGFGKAGLPGPEFASGSRWKVLGLVTSASTLMLLFVSAWALMRDGTAQAVERIAIAFDGGQEPFLVAGSFDITRDGSAIVYEHQAVAGQVLMLRRWSDIASTILPETTGATRPTWSPSGTEVAFIQSGQLKVLSLAGRSVRTLGEVIAPVGTVWADDGRIYTTDPSGVVRYDATGDTPELLAGAGYRVSDVLPNGLVLITGTGSEGAQIRALDASSGESWLVTTGRWAQYAKAGYLLYESDGTLMAAPFDEDRGEMTAASTALLADVEYFTISDNGRLFYATSAADSRLQMVWVRPPDEITPIDPAWTFDRGDINEGWSLSPDGLRLAVRELTAEGFDIWIKDLQRLSRTRLTFDAGQERSPVWSQDGRKVIYISFDGTTRAVFSMNSDGAGAPIRLLEAPWPSLLGAGPVQEWVVVNGARGATSGVIGGRDVYAFRPGIDSVGTPLLSDPEFDETHPSLSPDGRWLAYASSETGRFEVYLRPFPNVHDRKITISGEGGSSPLWSRDGRQLFYLGPETTMMVVDVNVGTTLDVSIPRRLVALPPDIDIAGLSFSYDVAADGRFVMARRLEGTTSAAARAIRVDNFFEELRQRFPR